MRGTAARQAMMLTAVTPDALVPHRHPIRQIKPIVDAALAQMSPTFERMYAQDGRPSIPPEHLLKGCLPHGSALLTGWPRSRETAPLGVRRMQMMRHDDRQRSDWLGVRRASSADRRAGRGKVHEARIAVDFSESPAEDGDSG